MGNDFYVGLGINDNVTAVVQAIQAQFGKIDGTAKEVQKQIDTINANLKIFADLTYKIQKETEKIGASPIKVLDPKAQGNLAQARTILSALLETAKSFDAVGTSGLIKQLADSFPQLNATVDVLRQQNKELQAQAGYQQKLNAMRAEVERRTLRGDKGSFADVLPKINTALVGTQTAQVTAAQMSQITAEYQQSLTISNKIFELAERHKRQLELIERLQAQVNTACERYNTETAKSLAAKKELNQLAQAGYITDKKMAAAQDQVRAAIQSLADKRRQETEELRKQKREAEKKAREEEKQINNLARIEGMQNRLLAIERETGIQTEKSVAAHELYNRLLQQSVITQEQLTQARLAGSDASKEIAQAQRYLQAIEAVKMRIDAFGKSNNGQLFNLADFKNQLEASKGNLEAMRTALSRTSIEFKNAADTSRQLAAEQRALANSSKYAGERIITLNQHLETLKQKRDKMNKLGISTVDIEKAIADLNRLLSLMREVQANGGRTNSGLLARDVTGVRDSRTLALEAGKRAATQITEAERALQAQTTKTTAALRSQASTMGKMKALGGDLRNIFTTMFPMYGPQQFLMELINMGGEFQKQHIALESIIGDISEANTLFTQLKTLSIESPFTFLDFAKQAKGLAAFDIPYKDLYETTRRLADVSAGLGTDIQRIVYAYGQTNSATVLNGKELRQFAYAGIPMLKELAKNFSEVEGKAISTQEVFKRITKRQVTFEDVKKVFENLTDEGGMFYGMQEKLMDSLLGKWMKVLDVMQLFYSDLSESWVGSGIGGILDIFTELLRHTKELTAAIAAGTAAWLARKAAARSALSIEAVAAEDSAVQLRHINDPNWRTFPKGKRAAKLVKTDPMLNAGQHAMILETNQKSMAAMRNGNKVAAAYYKGLSKVQRGLYVTANAAVAAGRGIAAMSKAILTSPIMWAVAIAEAWVSVSNALHKYDKVMQEARDHASELYKQLKEGAKDYTIQGKVILDYKVNTQAGRDELKKSIGAMSGGDQENLYNSIIDELQERDPEWAAFFNKRIAECNSLQGKLEAVVARYGELAAAARDYGFVTDAFGEAFEATDGWFDDSVTENIQDADKAFKKLNTSLTGLLTKHPQEIEAIVASMREADPAFNEAAKGCATLREQIDLLVASQNLLSYDKNTNKFEHKKFLEAWEWLGNNTASGDVYSGLNEALSNYKDQFGIAVEDVNSFIDQTMDSMATRFAGDKEELRKKLTTDASLRAALAINAKQLLMQAEGVSEEMAKRVLDIPLQIRFGVHLFDKEKEVDKALTDLQKEFIKRTGAKKGGELYVAITAKQDSEGIIDGIQKAYKSAKEKIEQLSPLVLGMKIAVDKGNLPKKQAISKYDLPWLQEQKKQWNEYVETLENAVQGEQKKAYSLGDEKKKTSRAGGGTKRDTWLDEFKKRIQAFERYCKLYEDYLKLYDQETAKIKAREAMGNASSLVKGLDATDKTGGYRILSGELARKGTKTADRKAVKDELVVKEKDSLLSEEQKLNDARLKKLDEELKAEQEQYETFRKWYEATGNAVLAKVMAGGVSTDDNKQALRRRLADMGMTEKPDDIMKLAEPSKFVQDKYGPQFVKVYEAYVAACTKLDKENADIMLKLWTKAQDFQQKIDTIAANAAKSKERIAGNANLADSDKKRMSKQVDKDAGIQTAKVRFEAFKETSGWVRVFEDLDRVSTATMLEMQRKIRDNQAAWSDDVETMKTVVEALEKIRRVQIERNPIGAIISGLKEQGAARSDMGNAKRAYKSAATPEAKAAAKQVYDTTQDTYRAATAKTSDAITAFGGKMQAASGVVEGFCGILANFGIETDSGLTGGLLGAAQSGLAMGGNIGAIFGKAAGQWGAGIAAGIGIAGVIGNAIFGGKSEGTKKYEAEKQRNDELSKIFDDFIQKQKKLFDKNYGETATKAGKEQLRLLEAQQKMYAQNARNATKAGAGKGSHSYGYRTDRDVIGPHGWQILAAVREKTGTGPKLGTSADLADWTADQLQAFKETYPDLWQSMSSQIRDELDQVIAKGEEINDLTDEICKKLTGLDLTEMVDSFADAMKEMNSQASDFSKSLKTSLRDAIISAAVQNILGQQLEALKKQAKAFGENSEQMFDANGNIVSNYSKREWDTLMQGANMLGQQGKNLEEFLKNAYGMKTTDFEGANSKGVSASIEGITEDTADLLASYINGIRSDVAVKRELLQAIVEDSLPTLSLVAESQLQELRSITENTRLNAEYAGEINKMLGYVIDKGARKLKITTA